jgi:LacI family transcriptional regulator
VKDKNPRTRPVRRRRKQETSIARVADKAGVSLAAVSKVFLGRRVEPARRQRVLEVARELDFLPRVTSPTILLAIGRTNPMLHAGYTTVLSQLLLQELARSTTYPISIIPEADENAEALEAALAEPSVRCVLAIVYSDTLERTLKAMRFPPPVVTLNHPIRGAVNVQTNHREHGLVATSHIVQQGHTRIAFLSHETTTWGSGQRRDGYREALHQAGVRPSPGLEIFSAGLAPEAVLDQLAATKATAVLSFAEDIALALVRRFAADIPRRLSVIGLDDLPIWDAMTPSITAIRQPLDRMARSAVEHAWRLARSPRAEAAEQAQDVILESKLILRESVGKPRG